MSTTLEYVVDHVNGLAYVQPARKGFQAARVSGVGHLTYRCHTCGELIPKSWEVLFVDVTPGAEWASYICPSRPPRTMTTHHDWHMASTQGD